MAPPSAPPARLKQQPPAPGPPSPPSRAPSASPPPDVRPRTQSYLPSSFLAPRVAVALNVPGPWHLLLFVSRLLSIAPAAAWGWPSALLLLDGLISSFVEGGGWEFAETASALACIWVCSLVSFVYCACYGMGSEALIMWMWRAPCANNGSASPPDTSRSSSPTV